MNANGAMLEIIGIHTVALEVAAKMLAQDRGGAVEQWISLLCIAGYDNYQKMHPAEFQQKLQAILAAIKNLKDEHHPLSRIDPVTEQDSELKQICEAAAR